MATETKLLPKEKNSKRVPHNPIRIKKYAVKEFETGELNLQQVMEKYQIIDRRSIITWIRQYSKLDESEYVQKAIPLDVRRTAAYQVEEGTLTIHQAAKKYSVTSETIRNWEKRYSCKNNNANPQEMRADSPEIINSDQPEAKKEPDILKLKIAALETMIDIAEKEYNIEIRKKAGTKQ